MNDFKLIDQRVIKDIYCGILKPDIKVKYKARPTKQNNQYILTLDDEWWDWDQKRATWKYNYVVGL